MILLTDLLDDSFDRSVYRKIKTYKLHAAIVGISTYARGYKLAEFNKKRSQVKHF